MSGRRTVTASHASATCTILDTAEDAVSGGDIHGRSVTVSPSMINSTLRVQSPASEIEGGATEPSPRTRTIHWTPETVDNEHLNRKKSNSKMQINIAVQG